MVGPGVISGVGAGVGVGVGVGVGSGVGVGATSTTVPVSERNYQTYFTDGLNVTGMMADADWAASNREGLKRFLTAWFEAVAWGNDPANRDELRAVMARGAGVELDSIKTMEPSEASPDGKFIPGYLAKLQDLLIQYGLAKGLDTPLAEDKFVDLSYLP